MSDFKRSFLKTRLRYHYQVNLLEKNALKKLSIKPQDLEKKAIRSSHRTKS